MPIFFPLRSLILLISGFTMSEKTMRFVAPATNARFEIRLGFVVPVHERKGDLASQNRLDGSGARWDMNQLNVQTVFLEEPFLLCQKHAALRSGYGRPVDARLLRQGGWRCEYREK